MKRKDKRKYLKKLLKKRKRRWGWKKIVREEGEENDEKEVKKMVSFRAFSLNRKYFDGLIYL